TAMPGDYYHFDPLHHRLSGERSGRSFRLGDSVEVRVMRVDLDERKIDFELISGGSKAGVTERGAADGRSARKEGRVKKTAPGKEREPVSAEVRKSREMKKALLSDAKDGNPAKSKSRRSSAKPKSADKS